MPSSFYETTSLRRLWMWTLTPTSMENEELGVRILLGTGKTKHIYASIIIIIILIETSAH